MLLLLLLLTGGLPAMLQLFIRLCQLCTTGSRKCIL